MYKILLLSFTVLLAACNSAQEKNIENTSSQDTVIPATAVNNIGSSVDTISGRTIAAKTSNMDLHTTVDKNYLLGKFDFQKHPDFVKVEAAYTSKFGEAYLRKETYEAFKQMADAAKKEGVKLTIISASRNFNKQKEIWENKWKGKYSGEPEGAKRAEEILKFSSMPSTSRHHWGTDIDLNSLNDEYFQSGDGKKVYEWLLQHAATYGFCNVYSAKDAKRPNGYNEEKWHWSYLPLAKAFLAQYKSMITLDDITDFEGSDTKTDLSVIKNYVEGINPECQ